VRSSTSSLLRAGTIIVLAGLFVQAVAAAQNAATPLLASMPDKPPVENPDPTLAALGRKLFFDTRLSEPQGTSCASCHDPRKAYSGNHGSRIGVALGSKSGSLGTRNTPSLLYVRYTPARFFYEDDDALQPTPFGGLFADGRADTLAEQALGPLYNPLEMNNGNASQLAAKLQRIYGMEMRKQFGPHIFRQADSAVHGATSALQAFLQSDEMAPFSSRYDQFIRGSTRLSTEEMRGLRLFKDADKGNCASCHRFNETSRLPQRSLFTDFGYDAVAVPRNNDIPANWNQQYYDHGLCQTASQLHWANPDQWCAYFKTPSLRNVAVRERYMHNGVFTSLREVVAFYATRATQAENWYKSGIKFDDVAPQFRTNVNVNSVPYNRRPGSPPALNDQEIDDIVAFLKTLTDAPYHP